MCLVGPVQLVLRELKPHPQLWDTLVARLGRLPEFVETIDRAIVLQGQLFHRFTPATDCPPFPGAPDFLSAKWVVLVTLSGHECLAMLGTRFQDRAGDYEFPADLPLAQLDPFMPLVDDLESFLRRLDVALESVSITRKDARVLPVLDLDHFALASHATN
jgi:hypothetical protein